MQMHSPDLQLRPMTKEAIMRDDEGSIVLKRTLRVSPCPLLEPERCRLRFQRRFELRSLKSGPQHEPAGVIEL
ncbi:hypothetical protein MSG28_009784 [Choristoneura fumiferana]|uniref:Uncharacterized protein n=1 Tax=Choristoneura fumiferana TaxID=7141 RepID=A0ACC0JCK7_CHOFU|nr:hypothetical protein MSG28_009784 [Choristoneura fumiferana]